MQEDEYDAMVLFLESAGQTPRAWPAEIADLPASQKDSKKGNWRKKCSRFYLAEARLYKNQPRKTQRLNQATGEVEMVSELKQVRVVRGEQELKEVLTQYHGTYHVGREGMLENLGLNVWWPAMRSTVDAWIASCEECQQRSKSTWKTPLQPIVSSKPMERWQIDFTGPYTYDEEIGGEVKSRKKMCLLVVDSYSKMLWGDVFSSKKCKKVADFLELRFKEEGVPKILQADNGGEFTGEDLKDLLARYNVQG